MKNTSRKTARATRQALQPLPAAITNATTERRDGWLPVAVSTLHDSDPANPNPLGWRSTPQDPEFVCPRPEYSVRAKQSVQLESIPTDDGKPGDRWMQWVATVTYTPERDAEGRAVESAYVALVAEETDYSVTPPRKATADIAHTIGILSVEEFRAVVAGLNALAATLPRESPFARAVALERGA